MWKKDLFSNELYSYLLETYPGKNPIFNWVERLILIGKINIQEDSFSWWKPWYDVSIASNKWDISKVKCKNTQKVKDILKLYPYKQHLIDTI